MVNSHGRFVWYELMTTDIEAAKAFYANVVGWGARDASDARYGLYPVYRWRRPRQRADEAAGGREENGRAAALDRICRSRRRGRCRRPDQAAWRSGARPTDGRPRHQPLFGRRRPANGNACVGQGAEARPSSSPPSWAHRAASAGTSCSPPTGRRRSLSTASYLAGKKRTPTSARWARISSSPPEGRRSAACSPSLRRCRFPSGSTISTSATSRRRRSAWRPAAAKSSTARLQCRAAPGSSNARTLRAPYSRCWTGASATPSDISLRAHRAIPPTRGAGDGLGNRELAVIAIAGRIIAIWQPLPQPRPRGRQSEAPDFAPRPIAN